MTEAEKTELLEHLKGISTILASRPLTNVHTNVLMLLTEMYQPNDHHSTEWAQQLGTVLIENCPNDLLEARQAMLQQPFISHIGHIKEMKVKTLGRKKQCHQSHTVSRERARKLHNELVKASCAAAKKKAEELQAEELTIMK